MKLKHSIQDLLQNALDVEEKREKDKAKATRDAAPPIQITEVGAISHFSSIILSLGIGC